MNKDKPGKRTTDRRATGPSDQRRVGAKPPFKRTADQTTPPGTRPSSRPQNKPLQSRDRKGAVPFLPKTNSPSDQRRPFTKPPYKRTTDETAPSRSRLSKPEFLQSDQRRPGIKPPFKRTDDQTTTKRTRPASRPRNTPLQSRDRKGAVPFPPKTNGPSDQRRPFTKPPYKRTTDETAPSRSHLSKREFTPRADDQRSRPPRPPARKNIPNRPSAGTPPTSKGPKELLKTLDRILSKSGLGSRTDARSWIGAGRVRVNGLLVQTPDYWVNPKTDNVLLDDQPIDLVERRYILLNKPKGYLTTYKDPENRPTVYDLLKGIDQFLSTVGRLDLDTSGLLLMTNDNDLCEAVTNPAYKLEKTYLVKSATLLTDDQLDRLRQGVDLDDGRTKAAEVVLVRQSEKHSFFEITITEGRNRQVRRMLEAIDSRVLKLVRVRLGPLNLEGLPMGTWRDLTEAEIARLTSGMARPKKTAPEPEV